MFKIQPFHVVEKDERPFVHFYGLRVMVGRKINRYFDFSVGYAKGRPPEERT